ncbi:uncharacterized protein LOC127138005 [Lathyrus oleraceus]|uniref:uncharacterized protein LOC127138005 n=1 Tax=Pisum sativum TaxID=3888 RepID=UPI0021CF795F|nr:uncharacterized protein LOC127138005 [Pisum sativum]
MVVHTLVQFYDPPLRYFTFQDYQLAPTLEEYSHILGIGIKNRVPYVCNKELPKSHILVEALHLEKKEVELNLKLKSGIHGFTSKFLVDKAITFVDAERWMAFNAILALIMGLCFILHIPNKGHFIENKDNLKWSQRIMSLNAEDVSWYSRSYDNVKLVLNYGDFPNVPLLGTKDGINYNLRLALCQLGYPRVDKPDSNCVKDFVLYEGVDNPKLLKKIIKDLGEICPQGRAEMGKKNCIAREAYTRKVKNMVKEMLSPFPSESSMSIKPPEFTINHISEVDKLKGIINALEKENVNLRSSLGKISLEKENLKFNMNQNRDKALQEDNEVQAESYKRRNVGESLKGTCASLSAKKKKLAETQY